ncbi:MAG: hypothetical protein ABFD79_08750 [Phycisphaerales bacterium]
MKFSFYFFCVFYPVLVNAAAVLEQNFEDSTFFLINQSICMEGVGDGNDVTGLWKGEGSVGDLLPTVVNENSTFSYGEQSILISRISSGGGILGKRTNNILQEHYEAEFSFKPVGSFTGDKSVQFGIYLADSENYYEPIVAYMSGLLYTNDNGGWGAKTSMVVPDNWYRIKLKGSLVTGLYNAYIDFGAINGWRGWQLLAIDQKHTDLKNIAGIFFSPWTSNHSLFIDDIKISGDIQLAVSCSEMSEMKINLAADLNRDCKIDFKDMAILANNWLKCKDPANQECD